MNPTTGAELLETQSAAAFVAATEGLERLEAYASSRSTDDLQAALASFDAALTEDPQFLRVKYFKGILLDLLGHPAEAVELLEPLAHDDVPFADEIRYTLALANYHRYVVDSMTRSMELFDELMKTTDSDLLRLMARAGLARCYGIMILHSRKTDLDKAAEYHRLAVEAARGVLGDLDRTRGHLSSEATREIKWRAHNALGVAEMFFSDLEADDQKRAEALAGALKDFEKADKASPNNWEIVSNFGSVSMRLAYLSRIAARHEEARRHLTDAVKELERVSAPGGLHPGYGFAWYEIGRAYRLQGEFGNAGEYLQKAKSVQKKERAVGDSTVKKELDRVANQDDGFYL